MEDLQKEVRELFNSHSSLEAVETELLQKGFLKQDISNAIHKFTSLLREEKSDTKKTESRKFFLKEIFDRLGYGLGSEQYINIFFMQSGASFPLIALVNGIKAVLASLTSSFMKAYSSERGIDKRMIGYSGIIYGYCFIMMAAAVFLHSPLIFLVAVLLGALGVVSYGEFYQHFMKETLGQQKEGLIAGIYKYGLLISVISLLLAAFLMDRFQLISLNLSLFGKQVSFNILTYLFIFELAALLFILSGYVVSQLKSTTAKKNIIREIISYIPEYSKKIMEDLKTAQRYRAVFILLVATSLTGFVQLIGNSFYGIFIYREFAYQGFGGFLNVAMISILALATSLLTPIITRENVKAYGKYPMLIFGTFLMAIMPLAFYFNPNLVSIGMGTILGVMGAAITGIANGMLFSELIPRGMKTGLFEISSLLTLLPYIILVPIGAVLLSLIGLSKLFLLLTLILLLVVAPLYFVMMLSGETKTQSFN